MRSVLLAPLVVGVLLGCATPSWANCVVEWEARQVTVRGAVDATEDVQQLSAGWTLSTAFSGPNLGSGCAVVEIWGTGSLPAACKKKGARYTVTGRVEFRSQTIREEMLEEEDFVSVRAERITCL